MARAQGARAQMALAFETTYGAPPVGGFTKIPFASTAAVIVAGVDSFTVTALAASLPDPRGVPPRPAAM